MAEAGAQLAQALEHAPQYNSPLDILTARIYQSMSHVRPADWDGAQTALDEAESLIRSYTIPPVVNHSWSLQQARICLERGEIERAEEFIGDPAREVSSIFFVRVLLKKGELEKAQKLLSQLEQAAVAGRRHGTLIQILLLQATAYRALDELPKALETLLRSLNLAYPEAYLMTFLEAGVPIYDLLKRLRSRPLPQPLAAYVLRLLQAFEQRRGPMLSPSDAGPQGVAAGQERASPTGDLVEPLSERELEVLHLISTGRTNKEIAGQLVVSPGTVKAHTASIYRKLDVANRTEAVARARQLGLLP